ncbi:hypothetical protein KHA80_13255 [Anaerobacillus sp. HL2]|nr:hypothetical protein KHA80_13255 [Anaerobacillus sp. HL2]
MMASADIQALQRASYCATPLVVLLISTVEDVCRVAKMVALFKRNRGDRTLSRFRFFQKDKNKFVKSTITKMKLL